MKSLKGTRTAVNLMQAFAGESQATMRYTYYASQAKKEGYVQRENIFLETKKPPKYTFDFRRALTDCLYQGFVMTLNRPLRTLMLQADMDTITSHDWWAVILAERFGVHYFDDHIGARHRRLDTSISGMNMKNRIKWLVNTFRTGDTGIRSCAKAYTKIYGDGKKNRSAEYARWFSNDQYRVDYALKKAFYPGRWRPAISSEIVLRFLMLTGKV